MNSFKLIVLSGVLIAVITGINNIACAQERPPQLVVAAEVQLLDTAPKLWVPATVLSKTDALLGVEVEGRVIAVAEAGTRLTAGDEVARLDAELWKIAASDATANVKRLQARLRFLNSEAERLRSLANDNSAALSALEESVAEQEMAVQDLSRAKAEVKRSEHLLSRTSVTTPFTGQVVERLAVPGEYLGVGDKIARVVDLANLEVRAQAPIRVAPFIHEGATLPIQHNGSTFDAKVNTVIPVGDLESRSFEIRLSVPSPNWVIGTPIRVGLPSASARQIFTVPRDALVLREQGSVVFKIVDSKVVRVAVETGIGAEDRIEVKTDQLAADDRVVVRGAELLRDGQSVTTE